MPQGEPREGPAVLVAEDQPPANRPNREGEGGDDDGEEQPQRVGVLRVRPYFADIDLVEDPAEQRHADDEPDQPGSPPALTPTRLGPLQDQCPRSMGGRA